MDLTRRWRPQYRGLRGRQERAARPGDREGADVHVLPGAARERAPAGLLVGCIRACHTYVCCVVLVVAAAAAVMAVVWWVWWGFTDG